MTLEELFKLAVQHRNEHDCSAYPYENYQKLLDTVNHFQATNILEIGTGIGFTSTAMAKQGSDIHIDTLEKDFEHAVTAKQFFSQNGVEDSVNLINGVAEEVLPKLQSSYDLIFFDGYQIHYEFLPHYTRLLNPGGILYLANNQLSSKTSDKFWEELEQSGKWKILERFADTTIAQRSYLL